MQNIAKNYAGIWIDHKHAFIVFIYSKNITLSIIESHVPSHHRSAGGTRSSKAIGEIVSEGKSTNRFKNDLCRYYDEVISKIDKSDSILIIGPGKAKKELLKRIEGSHISNTNIAGIETTDKMTENQIMAYVKDFFHVR